MSASASDKLRKGFFGPATTLSAAIGSTDATIPIASTVGLPIDTAIDITIDRVDANGTKTPNARETITCVISGTNGTLAVRGVEGTAQSHASGAVVEITFTAATHNSQISAFLADHVNGANSGSHNTLHDTNGKTWIGQTATTNAVNYLNVANSATGGDLVISAQGSDSNVNIDITPKGTGTIVVPNGSIQTVAIKNPYKFSVYLNSAGSLNAATWTKILFDTKLFDTGSNYDATTNHRFTAPIAGFYQFSAALCVNIGGASDLYGISIYKNGSEIARGNEASSGISFVTLTVSPPPLQLAANDYIEVYGFNSTGGGKSLNTGTNLVYFGGFLISEA
jgi:hypothetical protein